MDQIPPYDFFAYVTAARVAVVLCSALEFLQLLCGTLEDSNVFAKFVYFIVLGASISVSAHNIFLNVDGREEIRRLLLSHDTEVRGRAASLVFVPAFTGVFVFLCVSGHTLFSLFVLVHVLASVGQLAIEAYEVSNEKDVPSGKTPPTTPTVTPAQ